MERSRPSRNSRSIRKSCRWPHAAPARYLLLHQLVAHCPTLRAFNDVEVRLGAVARRITNDALDVAPHLLGRDSSEIGMRRNPGATTGMSFMAHRSMNSSRGSALSIWWMIRSASPSKSRSHGPAMASTWRCSRVPGWRSKKDRSRASTSGTGHRSPITTRELALLTHG